MRFLQGPDVFQGSTNDCKGDAIGQSCDVIIGAAAIDLEDCQA